MTENRVELTLDDALRHGFVLKGTADRTLRLTDYIGKEEKVIIPEKVGDKDITSIGQIAFMRRKDVVSVTIPSKVRDIDSRAFSECYKMKKIFVAEDNPVYKDEDGVLMSKDGTKLLRVPEGIEGTFSIPEGIKEICINAFAGCQSMVQVYIPADVTYIDDKAASNCASFKILTVDHRNPKYLERNGALFSKDGTKLLRVPEGMTGRFVVPAGVTEILSGAFRGCCWLDSVVIPDSVVKIDDYAFYACVKLRSMLIPDSVKSVGAHIFSMCVNLESIKLPKTLDMIPECAFTLCKALKEVKVPRSVKSIGSEAFYKCKSLEAINFPEGLTEIEKYAFTGCVSLTKINLPESLTLIGEEAFKDCSLLKRVHILSGNLSLNPGIFGGNTRASITAPKLKLKK